MRHFFIRSLDILIGIFVVLMLLGVLLSTGLVFAGMIPGPDGEPFGALIGLGILVGGLLYVTFIAGFMYLGVGIYHNVKRTADAVEKMAGR